MNIFFFSGCSFYYVAGCQFNSVGGLTASYVYVFTNASFFKTWWWSQGPWFFFSSMPALVSFNSAYNFINSLLCDKTALSSIFSLQSYCGIWVSIPVFFFLSYLSDLCFLETFINLENTSLFKYLMIGQCRVVFAYF